MNMFYSLQNALIGVLFAAVAMQLRDKFVVGNGEIVRR